MADEIKNALIHRPGTGIAGPEQSTNPILERMTQDILKQAQSNGLSRGCFRVGKYLLREPDYRQILIWADAMGMVPEAVLLSIAEAQLKPERWEVDFDPINFAIEDGAIVSMVWDFGRLPLIPTSWGVGLLVRRLGFCGKWPDTAIALKPVLPHLQAIDCRNIGLKFLDLSWVPRLTKLICSCNSLTKLDLSLLPRLTILECWNNSLTELDLSPVPELIELYCEGNSFNKLDFSPVPRLAVLQTSINPLTELDLSPLSSLTELRCMFNRLAELDLTALSMLSKLYCFGNKLSNIDLFLVPGLTVLWCQWNQLTKLDLSLVPQLTELHCDQDLQLINEPVNLQVIRQ
ncbi:MAG: hypothetical protein EOM92_14080 [Gammaproteobacteria bacterium]|nr:hypothetical protein [Gammaproteobacteria bacterium]